MSAEATARVAGFVQRWDDTGAHPAAGPSNVIAILGGDPPVALTIDDVKEVLVDLLRRGGGRL